MTTLVQQIAKLQNDLSQHTIAADELTQEVINSITVLEQKTEEFITEWGINQYTVLRVGSNQEYPSIQDAWNSLQGKKLAEDVVIKVDDGTYPINILSLEDHPDAHHIQVEGNIQNPAACTLQFTPDSNNTSHGVIIRNVNELTFSGFRIRGTLGQTQRGIYLSGAATVRTHNHSIQIEGCDVGVAVYEQSIFDSYGLSVSDCIYGARVGSGSTLEARAANFHGNGQETSLIGIDVSDTSRCWSNETDLGNFQIGYRALNNSYLYCDAAKAENCGKGFVASTNSVLWNRKSDSFQGRKHGLALNCALGFVAETGSTVEAFGAHAEGCETGFFSSISALLIANSSHVLNCSSHGYLAKAMSNIEALGAASNISGTPVPYSPGSSGVPGNENAMIRIN